MLTKLSVGLINDAKFYAIQSNKVANTYAKYGLVNYNNFINQLLDLANIPTNK